MAIPNLDRDLMSLHRTAEDLQVPIRKAAHVELMTTGAPGTKAPKPPANTGTSYSKKQ